MVTKAHVVTLAYLLGWGCAFTIGLLAGFLAWGLK